MRFQSRAWGWTAAVAIAALALTGAAAKGWWTWGLSDMFAFEPAFADTVAILAAGDARRAGANIYAVPNPFDPLGRPHVYGPAWLVTGAIGLRVKDAVWVGPILGALFVIVAATMLRPRDARTMVLGLLLVCSPPVMLGISRGNNDLVVFLLLAAAAWLLAAARAVPVAFAGFALSLAAILKLYPFVALPVLALRPKRLVGGLALVAAAILGCVAIVWWWRDDFREAMRLAPDPRTSMAYGVKVLTMTWHALPGVHAAVTFGWILGMSIPCVSLWPCRRGLWDFPDASSTAVFAFLMGALCWIFCFVAVRNFPYRFVLILLAARLWLEANGNAGRAGQLQAIWWIVLGWLTPLKMEWAERVRHAATMAATDWTVFNVIIGVEQGMTVMLTLALLVGGASRLSRLARGGVGVIGADRD